MYVFLIRNLAEREPYRLLFQFRVGLIRGGRNLAWKDKLPLRSMRFGIRMRIVLCWCVQLCIVSTNLILTLMLGTYVNSWGTPLAVHGRIFPSVAISWNVLYTINIKNIRSGVVFWLVGCIQYLWHACSPTVHGLKGLSCWLRTGPNALWYFVGLSNSTWLMKLS